ncbi:MAG: glycoside hydrolase family 15 protein, partial [Gemmatimonadales bacterium]
MPAIGDYGIIGDCRSAALISRDGSLDWLCWPRFDSPSLFAAILDPERGGLFRIAPAGDYTSSRRYMGETNVLETTFRTESGTLRLRDLMPAASEREKARDLWPDHQVLRALDCVDGTVEVEVLCDPRPDFGRRMPRWRHPNPDRFTSEWRDGTLLVHGDIPLEMGPKPGLRGRIRLKAGEHRYVSICHSAGEPATIPASGEGAEERISMTLGWWTQWSEKCRYEGEWRDAVVRSALALKLLTYAPSGALIAAPTTSLPEKIGGTRNWDYRYCWLRDASMTLQTLFDLGYDREGAAYMSWLLHSTRLTRPKLGILYDVYGRIPPAEKALEHLEGYAGSRPVRVGNGARDQIQLDVYGEVVDALYEYVQRGGELNGDTRRMVRAFGEFVCKNWDQPDHGIWEIRSECRNHVHSRAMCWVALDRLLRLHESGHLKIPVKKFRENRDAIAETIE